MPSLELVSFLVIVWGLVLIVCVPVTPPSGKILRYAVIVAAIVWTIIRLWGGLPGR